MTIKDIDDYIYNFHSEHMSQKVTAGHRMPVYENSSPLSIMTAEELYNERLNNDLSSRNFLSNTFNYLIYRPRENYDEKEYDEFNNLCSPNDEISEKPNPENFILYPYFYIFF